jgi:predicted MPP superfamily phosphohydrolase
MTKWYIFVPVLLIVLVIYMFIQAQAFKIRYHAISAKTGLRFLHMTDIHISLLFVSARRIRKAIEKTKPDYILFSGDFLEKPKDLKKLVKWLKDINFKVPAYAVPGNHEHRCFRKHPEFRGIFLKAMQELGIKILDNDAVILKKNKRQSLADETNTTDKSGAIALIGIRDYQSGDIIDNQIISGLKDQYKSVVAFTHSPDIALHIPENSVDILIAGHLHGGQIWLPFNLEYLLLRKDKVSKMGYYKDFATIRNNRVYISRGLGTVLIPFRFLSIPEITVFDV